MDESALLQQFKMQQEQVEAVQEASFMPECMSECSQHLENIQLENLQSYKKATSKSDVEMIQQINNYLTNAQFSFLLLY